MLIAGIDIGAVSTKAVLMRDRFILGHSLIPTGGDNSVAGKLAIDLALDKVGLNFRDLDLVVTTGYGRDSLKFSKKKISEIMCHARGAKWLIPDARTVIDIGGQDCKGIRLDDQGKVIDFVMNERCAAGTGRFFEVIAQVLSLKVEDLGEFGLKSKTPSYLSNICTVFIESEVISLRAGGHKSEDIVAGIHTSIARRMVCMLSPLRPEDKIVFTGGCAKNRSLKNALEKELQVTLIIPEEPQLVGALGAALIGGDEQ